MKDLIANFFRNTLPNGLAGVKSIFRSPTLVERFREVEEIHCQHGIWERRIGVALKLALLLKPSDIKHYSIGIGRQVGVNTSFRNAEDVARRLRRICRLVEDDARLPDRFLGSFTSKGYKTLDDFLCTEDNTTVTIEEFLLMLRTQLVTLQVLLLDRSSQSNYDATYYERNLHDVLGDVYIILEGLFTAALKSDEWRFESSPDRSA